MKRYPSVVKFATVRAIVGYLSFLSYGVLYLTEGDIATGAVLLTCAAIGIPAFIHWRQRFR